jgi:anaerobic magnesium-protoporphyrin IX monomethyl ester cyclase
MKVLMISTNRDRAFRPSLPIGMVTVAAELDSRRHCCKCLDLCFEDDPASAVTGAVSTFEPDVVGVSIRNIDLQTMLEPAFTLPFVRRVVDSCRSASQGLPIVLGGAGFSLMPEGILRYTEADYGVVGPGETSFPELLDCIYQGTLSRDIPGVLHRHADGSITGTRTTDHYSAFGRAPLPARELYDSRYFTHRYQTPVPFEGVADVILAKRACPGRCAYCASSVRTGISLVLKAPSRTVDEVEHVVALGRSPRFEFGDGAFNMPYAHALSVCEEMARRGVRFPWNCMFSPGPATDRLVDLMASTGCDDVEMGAESGSNAILTTLRKHFRADKIVKTCHMLRARGIRVEICIFVGSPGESRDTVLESFDLMERLVPDDPSCHDRVSINFGYRLFKGTELHRRAVEEGVIGIHDDLAFPRYYVAPAVLYDDSLLDTIERRVVANRNWYLWWGIPHYPLRDRVRESLREIERMRAIFESRMVHS